MNYSYYDSQIGRITIVSDENSIVKLNFNDLDNNLSSYNYKEDDVIKSMKKELDEYFKGSLKVFKTPVSLNGTEFQKQVWKELVLIPYGDLITYGKIAKKLNSSPRAVARAIASNNILIVIPCHRVVHKDKTKSGYSAGVYRKNFLINLEKQYNITKM